MRIEQNDQRELQLASEIQQRRNRQLRLSCWLQLQGITSRYESAATITTSLFGRRPAVIALGDVSGEGNSGPLLMLRTLPFRPVPTNLWPGPFVQ